RRGGRDRSVAGAKRRRLACPRGGLRHLADRGERAGRKRGARNRHAAAVWGGSERNRRPPGGRGGAWSVPVRVDGAAAGGRGGAGGRGDAGAHVQHVISGRHQQGGGRHAAPLGSDGQTGPDAAAGGCGDRRLVAQSRQCVHRDAVDHGGRCRVDAGDPLPGFVHRTRGSARARRCRGPAVTHPSPIINNPFASSLFWPVVARVVILLAVALVAVVAVERKPWRELKQTALFKRVRSWAVIAPVFMI